MTDFLLFCLAAVGTTLIVVRGAIFLPVRNFFANETDRIRRRREKKGLPPSFSLIEFLHELLGCVQCTGFWCGVLCGLFLVSSDTAWASLSEPGLRQLVNRLLMLFCCGAAGSFLSPLADVLLEWLFYSKILMVRRLEDEDRRLAEEEMRPSDSATHHAHDTPN